MHNRAIRLTVLIIIALIAVAALALAAYHFFSYQKIAPNLLEKGTKVTFVEQGRPMHFTVSNNKLVVDKLQTLEGGVTIFEEVASPLDASKRVVIAAVAGVPGLVVGEVGDGDSFTILLSGGTRKSDLIARPDGTVVVAVSNLPAPASALGSDPEEQKEEPAENDVEVTGSADGPAPAEEFSGYGLELTPYLLKLDLRTGDITALGLGRSPRLLSDGMILALAPEGVVRIRVEDASRTMVFERTGAHGIRGGISPSGSIIALESADKLSTDFYRYDTVGESGISHLGLLAFDGIVSAFAFADEERFFIRTGEQVARLYYVPEAEQATALPIAVMGISH